jgi:hypothetical protein
MLNNGTLGKVRILSPESVATKTRTMRRFSR